MHNASENESFCVDVCGMALFCIELIACIVCTVCAVRLRRWPMHGIGEMRFQICAVSIIKKKKNAFSTVLRIGHGVQWVIANDRPINLIRKCIAVLTWIASRFVQEFMLKNISIFVSWKSNLKCVQLLRGDDPGTQRIISLNIWVKNGQAISHDI